MATIQEVELRGHIEQLDAQMDDARHVSTNAATNAAVTGLAEAVRTTGQSVSKPRPEDESREARVERSWKRR